MQQKHSKRRVVIWKRLLAKLIKADIEHNRACLIIKQYITSLDFHSIYSTLNQATGCCHVRQLLLCLSVILGVLLLQDAISVIYRPSRLYQAAH